MSSNYKLMLMLPVMYYARKLDSSDPDLVFKLRCAFYTVQAIIFSVVLFLYKKALEFKKTPQGKKNIYVAKPPEPFTDPKAKKKYMEVVYGAHIESTVTTLAGSSSFGVLIQTGLHFYKGMIAGFASQIIMGPFTLYDNLAFQFFILGNKDAFETKTREELTTDDEIVDKDGKPVVPSKKGVVTSKAFEEILLDTWDMGSEADLKPLMKALTKNNINYQTKESEWTPLMILAGLGVKDCTVALKKMKSLGADPKMTDKEGWNALHWTAFHGCADAAGYLLSPEGFDGFSIGLHTQDDKEGKNALAHAEAEKNTAVSEVILGYMNKTATDSTKGDTSEGLRKRK